jgi:hypothetical protein
LKTKEQLEKEINESRYFSLLGPDMEAAKTAEKRRLIDAIIDWCRYYWYDSADRSLEMFHSKSGEIFETVQACLKPGLFDPAKGAPLVHYLRASIGHIIRRQDKTKERLFKEFVDDDGGKTSEEDTFRSHYGAPEDALSRKETQALLTGALDIIDADFKAQQKRCQTKYQQIILTEQYRDLISGVERLRDDYAFIDYDWLEKYPDGKDAPSITEAAAMFGKKYRMQAVFSRGLILEYNRNF